MSLRSLLEDVQLFEFRRSRAEFYRDFAEMFRRNEAIVSFLEGEISNTQLTGQASRRRALRKILQTHQAGENASVISHLLCNVVPRSDAMMLHAVDKAPDKVEALLALADAVSAQDRMLCLVLAYSIMPAVALPICFVLVDLLGRVILTVDACTPVYARKALWEGVNGWAKSLAEVIDSHGVAVLAGLAVAAALLFVALPKWRGPLRDRVESWPVFGMYRDFQAGMLFASMAMMLRAGQTLQAAIEDLAQRSSAWMRWRLARVLASLDENPVAVLDAFRRGLMSPQLLARALTLNRSSPSFADVLVQLGTCEGHRVLARVKRAAVLANVMLIGIFASVATLMGVASVTVPGRFAILMEPSTLMTLRAQYEAEVHDP